MKGLLRGGIIYDGYSSSGGFSQIGRFLVLVLDVILCEREIDKEKKRREKKIV